MISRTHAWNPPTDVYETEDDLVVRIEVAGMKEEDFLIELKNRRLLISGIRQELAERRAYHRMEIRFGEFMIEMDLPSSIEVDQVQAVYSDGFLKVFFPKVPPRQIPISE
jgi:HSP20 family protein